MSKLNIVDPKEKTDNNQNKKEDGRATMQIETPPMCVRILPDGTVMTEREYLSFVQ